MTSQDSGIIYPQDLPTELVSPERLNVLKFPHPLNSAVNGGTKLSKCKTMGAFHIYTLRLEEQEAARQPERDGMEGCVSKLRSAWNHHQLEEARHGISSATFRKCKVMVTSRFSVSSGSHVLLFGATLLICYSSLRKGIWLY